MTQNNAISAYLDPEFASFWNEATGDNGGVYKQYVLNPQLLSEIGTLNGKTVVDLGCGNGYFSSQIEGQNPDRLILIDISPHNLDFARKRVQTNIAEFIEQDVTKPWKIKPNSVDVIFSGFLLNELEEIDFVTSQAFKTLKNGGRFLFAITHPVWDLVTYLRGQADGKERTIRGSKGYFSRGYSKFTMDNSKIRDVDVAQKYQKVYEIEHYQRPISDYFNSLIKAGFVVEKMLEPEVTAELLEKQPKFPKTYPIGLVFVSRKP
ncbi:MAG: class I SAM-dependent methyltransferase [Patescibacteria group bacterium]|jgi:ubiquinone/menaquinone biosynthesis C-methylase UbiE